MVKKIKVYEKNGHNQKEIEIFKPCLKLGWCPYGSLVKSLPLKEKPDTISCNIFGYDCPAFTMAEEIIHLDVFKWGLHEYWI